MSKILIVEDNDLNLKLFKDLITIKNHDVLISRDGARVLQLVKKEKPDLILMDIQLGALSGIDIIGELKADEGTKAVPIIAITAFAMKNDEAKIMASGCDMYLSKPVSIELFFNSISKFLKTEKETT